MMAAVLATMVATVRLRCDNGVGGNDCGSVAAMILRRGSDVCDYAATMVLRCGYDVCDGESAMLAAVVATMALRCGNGVGNDGGCDEDCNAGSMLAAMPGFDARDSVKCVVNDHVSNVVGGNVGNIHLYKRARFQNVTNWFVLIANWVNCSYFRGCGYEIDASTACGRSSRSWSSKW
jgi:hypothetical protein